MSTNQQARPFAGDSIALSIAASEINEALTPHYFGLAEEKARWQGSRVKLKSEVMSLMAQTQSSGGPLAYPINRHASWGELPSSLVMFHGPKAEQEFLVIESWLSRRASVLVESRKKTQGNDFVLSLKLAIPHNEKFMVTSNGIPNYFRLLVPLGMLDFLSFGKKDKPLPIVGKDYAGTLYEVMAYRYTLVDQRYEGFRNRPTALLALALDTDSRMHDIIERIRRKDGKISMEGIRKLSRQYRWEEQFVPDEARKTEGFGDTFLEYVDYQEVADQFN